MNMRVLFGFQGRAGRGTYALVGTLGALLKYGMDRWFAQYFLHQPWGLWSYLSRHQIHLRVFRQVKTLSERDQAMPALQPIARN